VRQLRVSLVDGSVARLRSPAERTLLIQTIALYKSRGFDYPDMPEPGAQMAPNEVLVMSYAECPTNQSPPASATILVA
jgi:hypothetical protein